MHNLFGKTSSNKEPKQTQSEFDLSASEIEVILNLLRDCNFKIKDIEFLYHALWKLQKQHEIKNKNN